MTSNLKSLYLSCLKYSMTCVASSNDQMSQSQNLWGELDNHVGVVVIVIKQHFP